MTTETDAARTKKMLSRTLAVFFAATTAIFGYFYLHERLRQPQTAAHSNVGKPFKPRTVQITPTRPKLADVSHINVTSTVIRDGVAQITVRNNNPYPIRGISTTVNYYSTKRKSNLPEHAQHIFVNDLIMPGQELKFPALDADVPALLAPHSNGKPDEWIPIPTFEYAEEVQP